MLKWTMHNRKIRATAKLLGVPNSAIVAFDLPAGWTCPAADICQSRADRKTGQITDGKACEFRCYAASLEAAFPSKRHQVWHNFDTLKGVGLDNAQAMADAIEADIPSKARYVRIHSHGDFVTEAYFKAWTLVALAMPDVTFYAYTKRADLLPRWGSLPVNFKVTVSHGGLHDKRHMAYPRSYVVLSVAEADALGVPAIDDAQSEIMCIDNTQSFGLLIHGTQPAGSDAGKAWQALKVAAQVA